MKPNTSLPLIEKYRAKVFGEIKGQDVAINEIKNFFQLFPMKKALILNGPAGTGKTSLALALANEKNLELFELNASDLRNRISLEEVLKPSLQQQSLFKKGKLILMDEADGITASDRGGLPELIKLIDKASFPVIITANDIWNKKFSPLRKKCQITNLNELGETTIRDLLASILRKENKDLKPETINLIIKNSGGDMRAALNDLQIFLNLGEQAVIHEVSEGVSEGVSEMGKSELREIEKPEISEREKKESIFNVLKTIFQSPTDEDTIRAYDSTQMDLNEIMLWVEENLPLEYRGQALAKAHDSLSKSDVFKGRIYRNQYWRFLVYQNFFLSAGISSSTKLKNNKFIKYRKPSRILKIWLSNQKNAKKKSAIIKYAKLTHMSKKKAGKESFFLPFILNNLNQKTKNKLDLNESEVEYLQDKRTSIILENELDRFRV